MNDCLPLDSAYSAATTEERLRTLTEKDFSHLHHFANCRLHSCGLPLLHAEDLVNKALHSVVRGTESSVRGRHPRRDELATPEMFLDFLRGAVCSIVEAYARKREFKHFHDPLVPFEEILLPISVTPDTNPIMLDLKKELFIRLKQRAPARLRETILAWEEVFLWSEIVPRRPTANHARDLRMLAGRILAELEPSLVVRRNTAKRHHRRVLRCFRYKPAS